MVAATTDPDLVRLTPVELFRAVEEGRIRYPGSAPLSVQRTVDVLSSLRPGYPSPRALLWQDPDRDDEVTWLVEGGELVDAVRLLVDESGGEPAYLDVDTGELVAWSSRPDFSHTLVRLDSRFLDGAEEIVDGERLGGDRADRVRAIVDTLRRRPVLVETVRLRRTELPRLLDGMPPLLRRGLRLTDLDDRADPGPELEPPASFFAWHNRPDHLVAEASVVTDGVEISDDDRWRALLAAEGAGLERPVDDPGSSADFAEDGRAAVRAVRKALFVLRASVHYPKRRHLVPEAVTVLVVARLFRRFPDLGPVPATQLLDRWVWRSALAGLDRAGAERLLPLVHTDGVASLLRLLDAQPAPELVPPGRDPLDLDTARGRLVVLGMADLHPRDLLTGALVDVERVRPTGIVRGRPPELANLVLHDQYRHGRTVREALLDPATGAGLLASHAVDATAVELLRAGDHDGFLARRAAILDDAVLAFWTSETEPAAPNRSPLSLLFDDDPAGDDDDAE